MDAAGLALVADGLRTAVAAGLAALAGLLLVRSFNDAAHRALALLLVVSAMPVAVEHVQLLGVPGPAGGSAGSDYGFRVSSYFLLAWGFAFAAFAVALAWPKGQRRDRAFLLLAVTATATLAWYAVDHGAYFGGTGTGPLGYAQFLFLPLPALLAWWAARRLQGAPTQERGSWRPLALGLLLPPLASAGALANELLRLGGLLPAWGTQRDLSQLAALATYLVLSLGALVLALGATLLLAAVSRGDEPRRRALWLGTLLAVPAIAFLARFASDPLRNDPLGAAYFAAFLFSVTFSAVLGLVGFALVTLGLLRRPRDAQRAPPNEAGAPALAGEG